MKLLRLTIDIRSPAVACVLLSIVGSVQLVENGHVLATSQYQRSKYANACLIKYMFFGAWKVGKIVNHRFGYYCGCHMPAVSS